MNITCFVIILFLGESSVTLIDAKRKLSKEENHHFQGIYFLRKTLDATKEWYNQLTKMRHGEPYVLNDGGEFVTVFNPLDDPNTVHKQLLLETGLNAHDFD